MEKLIKRLTEPSTYASIVGALALVGVQVEAEWAEAATMVGGAIAAVLGVVLKEKGNG